MAAYSVLVKHFNGVPLVSVSDYLAILSPPPLTLPNFMWVTYTLGVSIVCIKKVTAILFSEVVYLLAYMYYILFDLLLSPTACGQEPCLCHLRHLPPANNNEYLTLKEVNQPGVFCLILSSQNDKNYAYFICAKCFLFWIDWQRRLFSFLKSNVYRLSLISIVENKENNVASTWN